jgi:hypothetical protein
LISAPAPGWWVRTTSDGGRMCSASC